MRILEVLLAGFGVIGAGWASWNAWTYLHSATYAAAFRGDSVWPVRNANRLQTADRRIWPWRWH